MGKTNHSDINPHHYRGQINGRPVEAVDIIEAFWADDAHLSQAGKYLLRAGKKAESSYLKDVGKALWWCAKAIMFHGGQVELPPDCKPIAHSAKARVSAKVLTPR